MMKRTEYSTFLEWWAANADEYLAVAEAEDGNAFPLSDFIEKKGYLATLEGRQYLASHLRGEPIKRGSKRTVRQMAKEVVLLAALRQIQSEHGCTEYAAMGIYLGRNPDMNQETLKTYIRRAKATLKSGFGREITPVQKSRNSEP